MTLKCLVIMPFRVDFEVLLSAMVDKCSRSLDLIPGPAEPVGQAISGGNVPQ